MKTIPEDKLDYMRRLIAEIRKQIARDPKVIEAKKMYGDEICINKWVDVELLCMTIETEVLGEESLSEEQR